MSPTVSTPSSPAEILAPAAVMSLQPYVFATVGCDCLAVGLALVNPEEGTVDQGRIEEESPRQRSSGVPVRAL